MTTDLTNSLHSLFGFSSFRPGQSEAIQSLLENQNTLVVMPTGSGKSLIYQITALLRPGLALVISPLIALMKDQVDSLTRHKIPATFINSALSTDEQSKRLKALARGEYRLAYLAPERLRSVPFLEAIDHQSVSLLAVDEAHCISEWGHDFRPDYLHIASFREKLGNPITIALTATATPQVQNDIIRLLGLPEVSRIVTGFNRENLYFGVRYTYALPDKLRILNEMVTEQEGGATIVYVGTRRDAEEVNGFLKEVCNFRTQYYHAGLTSSQRNNIQESFVSGDLPIVVATNAFGMGIDRPDVRQVIHYAIPGSLESYYQEAGRAGRDGLEARAVILYEPQDRALQEFFIENSMVTQEELRAIYDALRSKDHGDTWMTSEDFSQTTGLHEIQVRVGLAQLERCGAIQRLGDTGLRMLLRKGDWDSSEIAIIVSRVKEIQRHRREQLNRMISYAETNQCRRQIILEYFGDQNQVEVAQCCDNCLARKSFQAPGNEHTSLDEAQRVPLVILDTVRRLKMRVGREKLAQILNGSHAKAIQQYHYDKHIYYGRLANFRMREIEGLIEGLTELGYLKTVGGKYPVLSLTPQGENAVQNKTPIALHLPRPIRPQENQHKKAKRQVGGTLEYTAQLLSQGLNPEQIAAHRGLAISTIYSHLSRLIITGKVSVEAVVSPEIRLQVEEAIQRTGSVEYLFPIKLLLPEEISYEVIRCVVEAWKLSHPSTSQAKKPGEKKEDYIQVYLAHSHPRPLSGLWNDGWTLGFHSSFMGSSWNRSTVGELVYRFKYKEDLSALPLLVEQALALRSDHPELFQVDAIVPVPPSISRPSDAASLFAKALTKQLGTPVLPALAKTRQTAPQKEMRSLAQKRANVSGAFEVTIPLTGKRVLVVDDLFDSGATMEEVTRTLIQAGAIRVCVLTLARTIHSDA